jgi:hypothetical protein
MATISLDKYDELKAKFLRVDRSYESLKSLSRKGKLDMSLYHDGDPDQLICVFIFAQLSQNLKIFGIDTSCSERM